MNVTGSFNRESLAGWGRQVRDAVNDRSASAAAGVDQAVQGLLSGRFTIAVLGKAKRGKSTLLNALLGRSDDAVAPIDKLPASSAISRIRWAEADRATVVFRDGRRESIAFDCIRQFVTEEHNPENRKGVDVVEIEGPFAGLDRDLELVDTPGAGSIHEHHDALLHAFIPQADAVIFLVTARSPLDQDELDLLRKVKAADIRKIFFAINRVDESAERDIEDGIRHNLRLLSETGVQVEQMHRISAKRAFGGDVSGSGVGQLMADIAGFLAANKGRVLSARFVSRVCQAAEPVAQAVDVELAGRRKSASQIESELAALRQKKHVIESEREFAEKEFNLAWSRAADRYEQGLKSAKAAVRAAVATKVHGTSVLEVSKLARQLPTVLTRTLEEHLEPVAAQFEEAAQAACKRLDASYPALDVGDAGAVAVRTREGHMAIAGSAAGVAVAAAGAGFATAGAAAAAAVAAANAAALAATTTVAAPSMLSGLLGLFGYGFLAPLATGTATVAAPAAISTPLWVALAGPVGWTLAGVGVLAVPFSWRLSKLKLKDRIDEASREQVDEVFRRLHSERLPAIRRLGESVAEEVRIRLDRQLDQIEAALVAAKERHDESETAQLEGLARRLRDLAEQVRREVPSAFAGQ